MLDLLQTGKFGVLTNQKLLNTTSNNITNVNTIGYTRQETLVYTNAIDWGIGATFTRRMYDQYVQREMLRDQGNVGFYDAYASGLGTVDTLLSNEDTAVSTSLNNLFSVMESAVQNTTSIANRRDLLAKFENLVDRFNTLNYNIKNELNDINSRVDDTTKTVNDLVQGIYDVNREVRALSKSGEQSDIGLQLMDKRDQMINELSQYVDINVVAEADGSVGLYLGNGQLLLNGDTYGQLIVQKDKFDPSLRNVSLQFTTPAKNIVEVGHGNWGGKLGGFLIAGDDMRQSMRDLGRLALAFADAMNEQNKSGLTLGGAAGGDLISKPDVAAVSNNDNYHMTLSFDDGEGSDYRNCDYRVQFDDAGNPTVYMIENGKEVAIPTDDVERVSAPGEPLVLNIKGHGVTMTFDQLQEVLGKNEVEFLAQPTINAAFSIKTLITKPEDFAFASVIRTNTNQHAGDATSNLEGVYHVGTGATKAEAMADAQKRGLGIFINPETNKPEFMPGAPQYVQFEGDPETGNYVIYDGDPKKGGKRLGYAPASCDGNGIFANAIWDKTQPEGFPGYEVSFKGTVNNGSSFNIELNTDATNDNSNGNLLANLRAEDLVHSGENVKSTFTQNYADLTSAVGSAVSSANTDLRASVAKYDQTYNLFYSKAGVNLDEEAANLIRYQQSYSACAKIINASQTIFDALIGAI